MTDIVTGRMANGLSGEQKRVVFAASLGTLFEWYDFFVYATLAPVFALLFFPSGNETAALLSAFLTYGAGFIVRPFGALAFGRIGDTIGRKYTFLVTIIAMGLATFAVGFLPTFESAGWFATLALIALRIIQGLAIGGEYGGAATYIGEYAEPRRRGFATGFLQTTSTIALCLALLVVGLCRFHLSPEQFAGWGWRIPFFLSILLLGISVYIRLRLEESPIFRKMKAEGKGSAAPLRESFLRWKNLRLAILVLLGVMAGQGAVGYTGHFYTLFFLTNTLKADFVSAYTLLGTSCALTLPLFVFFGWLSDKIGRVKIVMAGLLIAAIGFVPLYRGLTEAVNPALARFQADTELVLSVDRASCGMHIFVGPWSHFSDCDRARDFLTAAGLTYALKDNPGQPPVLSIDGQENAGWDAARWREALGAAGYPSAAGRNEIAWLRALATLFVLSSLVAITYAPVAALLVELFPTRIRYSAMSLPYHIGNGWFGGLTPFISTAIAAASGSIYTGLAYPIAVAAMSFVIGSLFVRENRGADLSSDV